MTVLLSSAGRRVALLRIFREAMSNLGLPPRVIACDRSRTAPAFHEADAAFEVPSCSDPTFIDTVLDICTRESVRLVVPTIDPELEILARHRERFEARGVRVVTSAPETVRITSDKVETHRWLLSAGIPTVRQALVDEVIRDPEGWELPLIVKPVRGSASKGVRRVERLAQLGELSKGDSTVVQTIARGAEYTVDVFIDLSGTCRCVIPRKRLEVRAGEVSKAVTVRIPAVEDVARRVAQTLPGAAGVLNVQVFHDPGSDVCAVIEINPRFGGGFPLSWRAGGRFPQWLLEEAATGTAQCHNDWEAGVVMLRWDDAVFVDTETAGLAS